MNQVAGAGSLSVVVVVVVVLLVGVMSPAVTEASLYGPFGPFGAAGQFGPVGGGYGAGAYPGLYPGVYPGAYPLPSQLPGFGLPAAFLPPGLGLGRAAVPTAPVVTLPAATPAVTNLRNVVSGSDVLSRLAVAELPEDLQKRAQDLQAASEQGFDACDDLLATPGAYWQYKRCQAFQLRNALTAAKALEQEATARAEAAAAAAATAAEAPAA